MTRRHLLIALLVALTVGLAPAAALADPGSSVTLAQPDSDGFGENQVVDRYGIPVFEYEIAGRQGGGVDGTFDRLGLWLSDVLFSTGRAAAERPSAVAAAERFAAIWATPGPDWYARLAGLATPALAAELTGADPPRPAPELAGPGRIYLDAPRWARIGVPAVGGTVVLDVVATGGGDWLVAAVDWRPA